MAHAEFRKCLFTIPLIKLTAIKFLLFVNMVDYS